MTALQGTYTTEGLIDEIRKLYPGNTQVHCAVIMAGPGAQQLTIVSNETAEESRRRQAETKPEPTPRVHRRDLGDEGLPVTESCEESRARVRQGHDPSYPRGADGKTIEQRRRDDALWDNPSAS